MKFCQSPKIPALRPAIYSISLLGVICALATGCSTTHYREAADKDVYGILEAKTPLVPGMTDEVNIEPTDPLSLDLLPKNDASYEFLGAEADYEVGASIISLEKALEIVFTQSREYQTRKERLYLRALELTLSRHQFAPFFSSKLSADLIGASSEAQKAAILEALDEMTGPAGDMIEQYAQVLEDSGTLIRGGGGGVGPRAGASTDIVLDDSTTSVEGRTSFGLNMLFLGGTRLALDVTTSFVEFLSGGGSNSAISSVSAVLTRPLLRGAGRDVVAEFLTQAERDVLYELRDFTRFRKILAVQTATQYYNVLQSRDAVKNDYEGLKNFQVSLDRERAFQAEGLKTAAQVARLEQSALLRDQSWTRSNVRYKRNLDNFKILLALPTDAPIVLDDGELETLVERGISIPAITAQDAVELAMIARLDLYTDRDRVFDAERRINVAANSLKADLDLVFTASVDSKDGNRFASFDLGDGVLTGGFDLDLPLDRKVERNTYRRALIDYEVAKRNINLATDTVKLQVRNDWRALEQAEKDYEISLLTVDLNRGRVDEEILRAELGLGNIIDQVDAQNDLTAAQTSLTNALVTHTIALLDFWRDIGILYVKNNGQWEEVADAR